MQVCCDDFCGVDSLVRENVRVQVEVVRPLWVGRDTIAGQVGGVTRILDLKRDHTSVNRPEVDIGMRVDRDQVLENVAEDRCAHIGWRGDLLES